MGWWNKSIFTGFIRYFSVFERCKIILYNSTYLKSNRHVWCVDVHATDPFLAHAIFSDQLMGMTSVRFFFFHAWNNNHCWAPMKKFWNVKNIDWAKWFKKKGLIILLLNWYLTCIQWFGSMDRFCCPGYSLLHAKHLHFGPRIRILKRARQNKDMPKE